MSKRGKNPRQRGAKSTAATGAAKRHAKVRELLGEKAPPSSSIEAQAGALLKDMGITEGVASMDRATLYLELRGAVRRNSQRSSLDRQVMASLGTVAKQANAVFTELQRTAEAERAQRGGAPGTASASAASSAPVLRPELQAKANEWNQPLTPAGAK